VIILKEINHVFDFNGAEIIIKAMSDYCEDVRAGGFPGEEHCYRMIEGEEAKFLKLMEDR
jgi:ketopantoate hydroxymethyltransferase